MLILLILNLKLIIRKNIKNEYLFQILYNKLKIILVDFHFYDIVNKENIVNII